MSPARFVALVIASALACIAFVGCASAQKDTLMAEMTLSSAISLGYHTIDGVDQIVTDRIRVKYLNGDKDGALQDYADYKPKIEKAREALNAAEDTVENADKQRQASLKINDWKQFEQWLPTLVQAYSTITQAIADIKELVQP